MEPSPPTKGIHRIENPKIICKSLALTDFILPSGLVSTGNAWKPLETLGLLIFFLSSTAWV